VISHEHRCIFVHIPRCGGTSIERVIWPGERSEAELWMGFVDPYRNRHQTGGLQHLLAPQIRQEVGIGVFSEYFKFAFVRNPFDRAVSQFSYMRERPDLRAFIGMPEDASFADYLSLIRRKRHVQWEPQTSFVLDADGSPLVDFVGRFESLPSDARAVFERLGIGDAVLPHENRSERAAYSQYYTDESRGEIEDLYADDLVRFGYGF
jgi:Sulfotransferase family